MQLSSCPHFSLALEPHLLIVCLITNFMTPSKTNSPACLAIFIFQFAFMAALSAQEVRVVETNLSNGMKLLMVERHDEPSIAGGWVAHVGSANEHPGMTGIAHLFEHMMFKGTTTIGTTDAPKDFEILAAQEKIRDEMRAEEAKMRGEIRGGKIDDLLKPENWTPHYRELQKQFQALVEDERKVLVKNEFDNIYTGNGASGMNAFTMQDMTAYFCSVPANKTELWMWMESERIFHPVFREFYAERDVVFEERRMRLESTPMGVPMETFNAMFWEALPYSWDTLGWPSDVSSISKPQADAFYATFYAPQNLTLILVGDFDPKTIVPLAEKYFGRLPRGKSNPPDLVTLEPKQTVEKRMNAEVAANPQVEIFWHTVPFGHRDSYALEILAQLLSTQTGRFYKALVLGSGVATDAGASQNSMKWAGFFDASGEAATGHTPEEIEKKLYVEIEKLQRDEVPAEELQKVKNNFAAAEYRKLNSNMSILHQIIWNEGEGDWREINNFNAKVQAVTAADVKRVASEYLTKDNRAVATFTRKPETALTPEK
jgi:predicted Zn-dependent peptidase